MTKAGATRKRPMMSVKVTEMPTVVFGIKLLGMMKLIVPPWKSVYTYISSTNPDSETTGPPSMVFLKMTLRIVRTAMARPKMGRSGGMNC